MFKKRSLKIVALVSCTDLSRIIIQNSLWPSFQVSLFLNQRGLSQIDYFLKKSNQTH